MKRSTIQSAIFCLHTFAGPAVSVGIALALLGASAFATASGQAESSKQHQKSRQTEKTQSHSRAPTFDMSEAPPLDAVPLNLTPHTVLLIEDFDGVTPPALPNGWTAMNASGPLPPWATSDSGDPQPPADSLPNAAFVDDPDAISDKTLDSPSVLIHAAAAQLSFRNNYDLEETYDGGVLEISLDGGAFNDVIAAGGSFVTGGYTQSINKFFKNPLAGRQAWSGNSGGFITTTVNLPPNAMGHNVVLRWRMGSDQSVSMNGWRIDNVELSEPSGPQIAAAGSMLLAEGCSPPNGALDPGETVTVDFCVENKGAQNTSNLVGTLEASGGVTNPSNPQTFGEVDPGGAPVCRSFTFTANGTCGGPLTATLHFQDAATNLGLASYTFTMGVQGPAFFENFDSVSVPDLPPGWVATNASPTPTPASGSPAGPTPLWATSDSGEPKPPADSLPNAAFVDDPGMISDKQLDSPPILISTDFARLSFRSNYTLEEGFDGGVLEISVGGGAFMDIIDAGGDFVSGGYNGVISTCCGNPLANRPAWTSDSGGFITTTVKLPAAVAGQNIVLRWRMGSDFSVSNPGWRIDDVSISEPACSTNCASGTINIAGNVMYCVESERPVPNVTLNLTGDRTASAMTDTLGKYQLSALVAGTYTVTPTPLRDIQPLIDTHPDTADALLVQRHFLSGWTILTGCAELAAHTDSGRSGNPDTSDALAIQRFFNNLPVAKTSVIGQWRFIPPSRSYANLTSNPPPQDTSYDTYVIGDVTGQVVFPTPPPSGPTGSRPAEQAQPSIGPTAGNAAASNGKSNPASNPQRTKQQRVGIVLLPNQSIGDSDVSVLPVIVSNIDPAIHGQIQAFQGDLTFDSTVMSFESAPVQKAGLTSEGNWSLAANVLGTGRTKTLRISCFSLGGSSLSGSGTLFELRLTRANSGNAKAGTALIWAREPNNFIFIDENLHRRAPLSTPPGKITTRSTQGPRSGKQVYGF